MNTLARCARFFLLVLTLLPALTYAQLSTYDVPRINSEPVIDGNVDDAEWAAATRVPVNIEFAPGDSIPAPVNATGLLMEDGEVLYIAFIAEDPDPDQIRAYYSDRDSLWDDDYVEVVLDTFNDERRAYQFYVNPLGIQADSIQDDLNNREDGSWNAIWDSAGRITENGYMVEMAIPFKQLRFTTSDTDQQWGLDLIRHYPRNREHRISIAGRDRDVSCYLCQISKAEGFADLERSRNLEVIPTITATSIQTRDPYANTGWQSDDIDPDGGIDVRWGINQDLYLNATINPDFSQVEADSAQLDINNTFSLYFPERRTFFLDGADYFNSAQNIVHTRNIADPSYGAKLTGKSGDHSFGLLSARDETTSFLMPGNLSSRLAALPDLESDVSIARYRYDVFENSSIGALVTDRRGDGYSNTVTSLDAVLRPTASDVFTIQTMRSSSDYPNEIQNRFSQAAHLSDSYHYLDYRHNDRRWDVWIAYTDVGADFRADLGFISRVDYDYFVTRVGHSWRNDGENFFSRIRVALDYDITHDQSGFELEEEFEVFLNMNGPMQSRIDGLFGGSKTYWNGQYFDEQFNQLSLNFSPSPGLELGMMVRVEDVVDFANTRLGRSVRVGPEIGWQLGRHIEIDVEFQHQNFDVDGGRLFTAKLTDAEFTYQFNARSFLRFTAQYIDNDRNPDLYVRPVQSRNLELTTQLLYSYKVNAATRFFVGYSDAGFQDDAFESIEQTSRAFFAKFSYAWQP